MTATRRLAVILAVDSWATRGSWVRMRRAASAAVPITLT